MRRPASCLAKAMALSVSLLPLISALSNTTVLPLPADCSSYPDYDNTTGIAGPWTIVADSTDKPIDGFGADTVFAIAANGLSWGFFTVKTTKPLNQTSMRCTNSTLQAHLPRYPNGTIWKEVIAAGTPAEEAIGFGFPDLPDPTLTILPYAHIVDGVRQPDVFLGALNVTTWGYNYQNNTEGGEYYYMRLLTPGSESPSTGERLNEGEFEGFIRVDSNATTVI
ncbi:uncharacterized protein BCR38DRAFT_505283 [Pseudomassariella vexata]|uniref:Uncharacterized protein n=1 Tax=Pseudomassariella vexata TaxID=1141098 RepID=A0A1Y2DAS8_9PEZI|nr:uncharacterized protein BCR38DRAFT_505283 [Pseudomassariella vexata]ORY56372.1 hypothetical protein BCR38DRAFT_505283 [Pseudomassariella vexata]